MKLICKHLWKFIFIPIFVVLLNFRDSTLLRINVTQLSLTVSLLIYFHWLDEWMVWLRIELRNARINAAIPEIPFKAVENCACLKNLLGSGAYANVYTVDQNVSVDTVDQEHPMVLKLFRDDGNIERNVENEIKLRKLKHRHLVKYLGCVKKNYNEVLQPVGILMKFVERKSLKDLIFSSKYSYSMYTVACWMEQLFLALTYLQKQQIIHRDIKPDNILLDDFFYLILADFGNAKLVDVNLGIDGNIAGSYVGTYRYMPPEVSSQFGEDEEQRISYRSDLYSTGIVIWEMIERRKIFMKYMQFCDGQDVFDSFVFYDDLRASVNALDLDPLDAPQNFIELVICCTIFNEKARLNVSEALDYSTTIKKTYETSDVLWEFFPKETNHTENSPIIRPKEVIKEDCKNIAIEAHKGISCVNELQKQFKDIQDQVDNTRRAARSFHQELAIKFDELMLNPTSLNSAHVKEIDRQTQNVIFDFWKAQMSFFYFHRFAQTEMSCYADLKSSDIFSENSNGLDNYLDKLNPFLQKAITSLTETNFCMESFKETITNLQSITSCLTHPSKLVNGDRSLKSLKVYLKNMIVSLKRLEFALQQLDILLMNLRFLLKECDSNLTLLNRKLTNELGVGMKVFEFQVPKTNYMALLWKFRTNWSLWKNLTRKCVSGIIHMSVNLIFWIGWMFLYLILVGLLRAKVY